MEYIIIIALAAAGFLFFRSSVLGKKKPENDETEIKKAAPDVEKKEVAKVKAADSVKTPESKPEPAPKPTPKPAPAAQAKAKSAPAPKKETAAPAAATPQKEAVPQKVMAHIDALQSADDPLSRHRLYAQITDATYKDRKDANARATFKRYAEEHVNEFSQIKPLLKKQNGGKLPQVLTFQNYANALMEDKEYDKAIAICEKALAHGLDDKTRTGFKGRIERIQAKAG